MIEDISVDKPWLMLGDCADRLREIPDNSIDLTVTSPPYDDLRTYNGYSFDFERTAMELYRVTKPGCVVVWVVGDSTIKGSETGTSFRQALHFKDECGFRLADTMIYHKIGNDFPRYGHKKYPGAFEYVFVLCKGALKTFNLIRDKRNKYAGDLGKTTVRKEDGSMKPKHTKNSPITDFGARSNVWSYSVGYQKSSKDKIAYTHPAIFPEALALDYISSFSNRGDIVLDPFMGSGTTGKMAFLSGRRFAGIEISDKYMEISKARIYGAISARKMELV